jgi:general secretion pathway protein J
LNRESGFTLIEVLVAITIFAIMSVVGYRGLNGILQVRERVTLESRKWRELALFFARVEADLTAVIDRPVRDNGDLLLPALAGKERTIAQEDALVEFTRTGLPAQSDKLADLQRFGYRLRDGAIEQIVWPVLDRAPRSHPDSFVVLQDVVELKLRYLNGQNVWQSAWPLPDQAGIPQAIEMTVALKSGETVVRVFAL